MANGLDRKKVATISVEKIEELYLLTIAQQELITKQRKEILALKNHSMVKKKTQMRFVKD